MVRVPLPVALNKGKAPCAVRKLSRMLRRVRRVSAAKVLNGELSR
jgi:hypothetical protein